MTTEHVIDQVAAGFGIAREAFLGGQPEPLAAVALVQLAGGTIKVEGFETRKAMIKALIDSASLGDGIHSSEAHLAALEEIAYHLAMVKGLVKWKLSHDAHAAGRRRARARKEIA